MRIALIVPPMLPVPPRTYAGTERVVAALLEELVARDHEVTLFASGDSQVDCELVPIVPESLWSKDYRGEVSNFIALGLGMLWRQRDRFDIIHSHAETLGLLFARACSTPVVSTLHGRLDSSGIPQLLEEFSEVPLVAISDSQRRWWPDANWVATVHHGLRLDGVPFRARPDEYLAFVGRATPEKGLPDAIALARRVGLPLRIAAKVYDTREQEYHREVIEPAVAEGVAEFLGELGEDQRDPLLAGARATIMLGNWPEPFGLVAIESMATGTPVIARRAGALTETIDHGVTGFLVDDVSEAALAVEKLDELDRAEIRRLTLERFSVERMTDEYEEVYRGLLTPSPAFVTGDGPRPRTPVQPYVAAEPQRLGQSSR